MKKSLLLILPVVGLMLLAFATPSYAASKGKKRTLTGLCVCTKCFLHETDHCSNAIQVKTKKGKTLTYYLAQNEVSKDFHDNVCKAPKKVTATGYVKKVKGKLEFTALKIKLKAD
jgi:Family of unknown function (DUF6370)